MILGLVALFALNTVPAFAQIESAPNPQVDAYLKSTYELRKDSWWKALNMQMLDAFNKSYKDIDEVTLQNAIYFGTHFKDKVDLTLASPKLLQVYRKHSKVEYRIMALAAIHAIGDAETMKELPRLAWRQQPVVKKMTRAAVADYQRTSGI